MQTDLSCFGEGALEQSQITRLKTVYHTNFQVVMLSKESFSYVLRCEAASELLISTMDRLLHLMYRFKLLKILTTSKDCKIGLEDRFLFGSGTIDGGRDHWLAGKIP